MTDFDTIRLNSIDSTNNYAMQLIDANKAHHGLTIVAQTQTGGRGQRGKVWVDRPGECMLASIIVTPRLPIKAQFRFNAAVAVAIAKVLQKLSSDWRIHIKWPNDIIVNDKKAGGVLIENVLRGSKWTHSVIGIGLNVRQEKFFVDLPNATSLRMASGQDFEVDGLLKEIWEGIINDGALDMAAGNSMAEYNALLYRRGQKQQFSDSSGNWKATVLDVQNNGTLEVQTENGETLFYQHGVVLWDWE